MENISQSAVNFKNLLTDNLSLTNNSNSLTLSGLISPMSWVIIILSWVLVWSLAILLSDSFVELREKVKRWAKKKFR